jgi:hypothetical protein
MLRMLCFDFTALRSAVGYATYPKRFCYFAARNYYSNTAIGRTEQPANRSKIVTIAKRAHTQALVTPRMTVGGVFLGFWRYDLRTAALCLACCAL